jgi:peptide/nickel transport system substrate-binding protein
MSSSHLRIGHRVTAALVAFGMLLAVTALPTRASAASKSTFTVAIQTAVSTFNPFLAYFDGELDAIAMAYPTLVWPDKQSKPTHYLADSWTTSSDKLTWTFKLHPGLKWSDGKPITAKDVAWTFNLMMTNKTAATANGQLIENFKSVTAPDDNTVVFTTKVPLANMLYLVGLPIVPQHVWESKVKGLQGFKNLDFPLVGYGPFTVTGYKTDQYATLKANKDFFLGAPKYDTVILQYFKNTDAAVAALRSGQVDQVDKLTATEYQALTKDKNLTTYQQVGNRWTGVEINPGAKSKTGKKLSTDTANPILADPIVRKAIAYGIDRSTLVKKVYNGLGSVGSGYLPPAFPEYSWQPSAADTVGYDPTKAGQLLDAAGYKKGSDGIRTDPKTGKQLSFRLGIHSDTIADSQIANYLIGWMKDIGIKLTAQTQSMTGLNENLAKGDWDLLMDSWGTGPDPTYLLGIQTCGVLPANDGSGGNTDAFFCNKSYDQLYADQQQEFDPAKRAVMIKQMQQLLYAENDDIILYYQNDLAAVRKDSAKGFLSGRPNSQGFYPFQNYKLGWINGVPPASSSSSSSSTGVIIGVVVAVVVILLIGGGLILRRRTSASDRE